MVNVQPEQVGIFLAVLGEDLFSPRGQGLAELFCLAAGADVGDENFISKGCDEGVALLGEFARHTILASLKR